MPALSAYDYSGICNVTASLVGMASPGVNLRIALYDPAELALAPLPGDPLVTVAGQPFRVGVRVTFRDLALGAMRATFSAEGSSPAGVSELQAQATSDADGKAYANAIANDEGGTYSIVASVDGVTKRISVNQAGTAVVSPFQLPPKAQGMWWSPLENGWGMSIVQHGGKLFVVLYAYDDLGKPVWFVMPTGRWNANFTRYAGELYSPRGSPFFQYDAARFEAGLSAGSIAITFDNPVNPVNAAIEYSIAGMTGYKLLVPQSFGVDAGAGMGPRTDMWWGGANQNGWGVAILQQGDTLFNVWFTYDATGAPTWFVMPGGHWTSANTYEGSIYRTLGSPWLGRGYDASRLKVFDAGPYRLRFDGDSATLDYSVDGRAGSLRLDKQPF